MKKNPFFCMSVAATFMMSVAACSNETIEPDPNGSANISPEDGVYMTVNFDMPTAPGARSYTDGDNSSNNGVEIGKDSENHVSDIVILLA